MVLGAGRWARPTPTESALEPADEVLGIGGRRWNRFTGCDVWLRHEHEKDYLCERFRCVDSRRRNGLKEKDALVRCRRNATGLGERER